MCEPKVVSSLKNPVPLLVRKKTTLNKKRAVSQEDVEYLQMEKNGECEGVNLRVLSSG